MVEYLSPQEITSSAFFQVDWQFDFQIVSAVLTAVHKYIVQNSRSLAETISIASGNGLNPKLNS